MNKKVYEYQTRILILNLEPGWVEYESENEQIDPLTFVKEENGVGSLQISIATARNEKRFDIHEALKRNHQEHIVEIKKYNINSLKVYEYEDTKDGFYTKFFNLIKPNVVLFVTYNCSIENLNRLELKEAVNIVHTIEIVDKKI